ncbi:MAG: tRNA preQ1(34) S-adenosylmethionine ribosyltransferase-isomerase QueA [Desulfosarcina sp.]|nr:tRNA preQ1(34) S-adenosylmethionine ribosyltransferase-isomerase QueA [Desulfobacterales bacterium]
MFAISDYNYKLPANLIAQEPAENRDTSRLLLMDRKTGALQHHDFASLGSLLNDSDILVVNNTEVIPGRLLGHKKTGGKVEALILDFANGYKNGDLIFKCLVKASKRPKPGDTLNFGRDLSARVLEYEDEICTLRFLCDTGFEKILYKIGKPPLPPYIKRENNEIRENDKVSYQTVYAKQKGAIAAPTAGLHFTRELLEKIQAMGIKIPNITLHVGYGTFLPVRVDDIREHKMHSESFSISKECADIINSAKSAGKRIIAVGTTCVRTLEYASDISGMVSPGTGECDMFIYPGYKFKVIDGLITNFHLPCSTLLMLVSAFTGRRRILDAYKKAINNKYRFYSYGDAMLIL